MASASEPIQFQEKRELTLLEMLLRDRGVGLPQIVAFAASALAVSLALFHLYAAVFGTPETRSFRGTHLAVMLVLAFLLYPLGRGSFREAIWRPGEAGNVERALGFAVDMVLVAFSIGIQVYALYDIEGFNFRGGDLATADLILGGVMIVLVLEATRRTVGMAMVLITGFFIVQSLFSHRFFWIFFGPPTSYRKYVDTIFMRADGIFGIPLMVVATYILLFVIFGALLLRSGAGRFFIDLAIALTGRLTGGPAKAAVVSSVLMGTVSGSAVANVATVGSFTIPLMKRTGYKARFAAAVEACASSGGQITPPVMGAAAFIIAEFLQVSYLSVALAATIPAALYFYTVYCMVHLEAEKRGLRPLSKEQVPALGPVLARGWHLLLSLVVLLALMAVGFSAMMAAFWGIVSIVVLSFVNKATRMSAVDLLAALESGVRGTIPVTIACAAAGIIIGSVFVSGLGLKFTDSIIQLSGGSLLTLLFLTAIASIILGMGLTTTAVYITLAALIIPALQNMQIVPIAAHMFAFYFGAVSTITPPVALAAFAAAAIAGTAPMSTAWQASYIGIAKYFVPFIFVYNPSILFVGPLWLTLFSTVTAVLGIWALSAAMEGWLFGPLSWVSRALLALVAIAILYPPQLSFLGLPGTWVTLAGALVIVVVHFARKVARRRALPQGG
jgi:TRAP transporter 4TM/12TM fusion protein